MTKLLLTILVLGVSGCASLSTETPADYDLTGQWQLIAAISDSPNLAALGKSRGSARGPAAQRQPQGGRRGGGQRSGGRGRSGGQTGGPPTGSVGGGRNVPVTVAVLVAKTLDIEQNTESMGVSYDGTNYRDVSWGERKRGFLTVDAGWNKDKQLVINTQGDRFPIKELHILSDDRSRLTIMVELDGGKDNMTFKRVFERVPSNTKS